VNGKKLTSVKIVGDQPRHHGNQKVGN